MFNVLLLMLLHVLLPVRLLPNGQLDAAGHDRQVLLTMKSDPRIAAGDVWHSLSEALHAFIRSRVPSASDADDILQDVFIRVIEKSSSLRQADRIESWVYQTARNAVADFYRRRLPRPEFPVETADSSLGEETSANQNQAVGAWLNKMSAELPDKLLEAVRLYEIEGFSQAEIANRLRISLSGAKSRVQRGRRQLEELLKTYCELELDRRGNVLACEPAKDDCCPKISCECSDQALEAHS